VARITFVEHDGREITVEAEEGLSVMKAAANNGIAGIAADCGGNAACGTCRIYVDADWAARLPAIAQSEAEMLDYTADATPGVRLSCQVRVTPELDGLVARLPRSQHD